MIPIDRILAELGKLYVQLQLLSEENTKLKEQLASIVPPKQE